MKLTNTYIVKNTNAANVSDTLLAWLYDLYERFSKMDYLKVMDIIWFFNYSSSKAWEMNKLPEDEFTGSIEIVQRELMRMLKLLYPETWKSLTASPANDTEKALSKALKSESAFGFVRDKISCVEFPTSEAFKRVIHLLTSEAEKNRFGGLKAIGFKKYEADFLKEVAPQIGEVLKEVIDVSSLKSEEPNSTNTLNSEKTKSNSDSASQVSITAEVAEVPTAPVAESQLSLILESQNELKELEKLYPYHRQYIKVIDVLLEKGFTMEQLTTLLGIN